MEKTNPSKALFIKLGTGGGWEKECLIEKKNLLRLGFYELEHKDCLEGKWELVKNFYQNQGVAGNWITTYINQLKYFYESSEDTL